MPVSIPSTVPSFEPSGLLFDPKQVDMKAAATVGAMLLSVMLVTALLYLDGQQESEKALDDFAREQQLLAHSLSVGLPFVLSLNDGHSDEEVIKQWLSHSVDVAEPGLVKVYLANAENNTVIDDEGNAITKASQTSVVEQVIRSKGPPTRVSRPDSAELGLPERMSVAGVAPIHHNGNTWTVVVVATAQTLRDREQRGRYRMMLGVIVSTAIVSLFGTLALRNQKKELLLEHKLALSVLRTQRDERLVRADKLATMGALATGIAHEVSTPLGVILGRAEQLLPKQQDEKNRRAVSIIIEQSERISAVIKGFLALVRGNSPTFEQVNPARLGQNALNLVEHRFQGSGVNLSASISPMLCDIACEPRLIEQVLVNLLLNARDACHEKCEVSLKITDDDQFVYFVVTDNGSGIDPQHAERLTEPFFTTKPKGQGTGLGLAIASEIVKHHRGELSLSPRKDTQGTCVTVKLPVAPATHNDSVN